MPNQPVWIYENEDRFQFISPVYDQLDTNIPHTLMNYSDQCFPKGSSLFPQHSVVRQYLEQYANDLQPYLKLGTQVLKIHPTNRTASAQWSVTTKNIKSQQETTSVYDAVVVANGHYDDPFIPNIRGLEVWNTTYPNSISHSKLYRQPDQYKQKVLVDFLFSDFV